ncbi:response regulator [Dyella sp.]|uniref:response regulator n=1 Tax=Dyella sp. TaxID=1869338 RepID=UPI003F7DDAAC
MAAIVLVEDEADLSAIVMDYLLAAGHQPRCFADGAEALAQVRVAPPELIVLDLMLPGLDGLSVCRAVRDFSQVPIIMTTAKVEEIDRLLGLEAGADDYLCKPYSPRELVARIAAVLRRAQPTSAPARLAVDDATRTVRVAGQALALTATEFDLLATMARRPGVIFSRAQLLDAAAGENLDVSDRAIDSHIKNLRRKLAAYLPGVELIQSVYGLGYRLEP